MSIQENINKKGSALKIIVKYFLDKLLVPILIGLSIGFSTIYFTNRLNEAEEKINKFNALITFTDSYYDDGNNVEKKQLAARALYAFDEKLANDWFIDLISNNEKEKSVILDVLSFAASKYSDKDIIRKNIEIIKSSNDTSKAKSLLTFIGEKTEDLYTKELVKEAIQQIEDKYGYYIIAYSELDSAVARDRIKTINKVLDHSKKDLLKLGVNKIRGPEIWPSPYPNNKYLGVIAFYGIADLNTAKRIKDILIKNGLPQGIYIVNWKKE